MSRVFIGQFKGAKGDKGDTGSKGDRGDTGATGERGSRIMRGTAITGTSTTGTKFPNSGITDAKIHDYYINTDTGNLYECTVPGAANTAEWTHAGSFKGPKGDTGPAGSISDINNQKPTYAEASTLDNISSGETVKIAFGKMQKALSVLISHYTKQATASILGHVKLSNSAAVTQTGQMALDAVEKNAAVVGTLANQISQVNSNLQDIETHNIKILNENDSYTISTAEHAWYNIKNGVCYFQMYVHCKRPWGYNQGMWYDTGFAMPKPLNGKAIYFVGGNYSDFEDVIFVAIRSDTNFSMRLIGGVAEKKYMISGSYLIASN